MFDSRQPLLPNHCHRAQRAAVRLEREELYRTVRGSFADPVSSSAQAGHHRASLWFTKLILPSA